MDNSMQYPGVQSNLGGTLIGDVRPMDDGQGMASNSWQAVQQYPSGQQQFPPGEQYQQGEGGDNIERLVRELDRNLPDNEAAFDAIDEDRVVSLSTGLWDTVSEDVIDGAILFTVYSILSHEKTREFIGAYIPQVDPRSKVGLFGIAIYGVIMVLIYRLSRRYLVGSA